MIRFLLVATLAASLLEARVTRIVIDRKTSPAFSGVNYGTIGKYETLSGRAYGVLDPNDPKNAIIQDIDLAPRNADGRVEYMATFLLVKPVDMTKSSGLLWHDVPNRGGRITFGTRERNHGDIGLSSGWQGDNAGTTSPALTTNDYAVVPVAKNPDGTPITGLVLGRIVNRSGTDSQPLLVQSNPVPYLPASLDAQDAVLTSRAAETATGEVIGEEMIDSADWAWARCDAGHPFPGVPDGTQICLRGGFDPERLYQVVFTAQDPPVLGIGFAAFRDVASFFRNAEKDDNGTANPIAGKVRWMGARGRSQSGNFLRGFLHLGFNQDEALRQVYDGYWPIVAGRRIGMNFRWSQPDGVLELYQAGSEGPQWWTSYEDKVRGLPEGSLLARCRASGTCPKILESFGSAEIWGLKFSPGLTGTDNVADLELPPNVRRYYIASSNHGGGSGGFNSSLPENLPATGPSCPGNNFGTGILVRNPLPFGDTENALLEHFRNWVMSDVEPPASRYPRIADGTLVPNTKEAMAFPSLPGLPPDAPTGLLNQLLDYDWGATFDPMNGSGVMANVPPAIRQVVPMLVPKVDADGNELGGVPVVLAEAPLGTYLGWNIVADGFHRGQMCGYAGGMIPFARTKEEREKSGDPRLSLEERYGDHAGYVAAVRAAAARAVTAGFLLQADADALIASASASRVLAP